MRCYSCKCYDVHKNIGKHAFCKKCWEGIQTVKNKELEKR